MEGKYPVLSAKAVRDRRHHAALTQDELATRAGLHVTTIRSIEAGDKTRKSEGHHPGTVRSLAAALGCQPSDLYISEEVAS